MLTPARWRHRGDHYQWLTSFLAARDLQTLTCRVVAWSIIGLGAIALPVTVSTSQYTPMSGPAGGAIVILCTGVMAAIWLRSDWPTWRQSVFCVVFGTLLIAASCLWLPHPIMALVGSTAFVVTTAYTVFFHSRRLLLLIGGIQAATLAILAWRLFVTEPVAALSSIALVVTINATVAFACELALKIAGSEMSHDGIEPLTGLLNRETFYDEVATLIGSRSRRDDRYFVLIVANLDSFSLLTAMSGKTGGNRARVAIGQRLRETVRGDAVIGHLGDSEYLIADVFTHEDPSPLADRILGTIKSAPFQLTASLGVVSTPLQPLARHTSRDVLDELVTIATNAMYEARKAGGNQSCLLESPKLATVDDDPENRPDIGRSA
ncbi:diguanylate cyclase [Mycolicibacterium sp. 120266]|uniref:GGDEF domain-containing protein n=1 Tax=Mycolicibacterium sp. 120266 TaxID=3090601 RepID=UPI00299E5A4C|nr:diguanylate cyclase [Mycolicibacterium sp. 120266]MDX1873102.1 diguanylate cyclase [Mycolicibacterium sp. 120266]